MKQNLFIVVIFLSFTVILNACNGGSSSTSLKDSSSATDSVPVNQAQTKKMQLPPVNLGFNQITNTIGIATLPDGQQFDLKRLARICVNTYNPKNQALPFTKYISFNQQELRNWINAMDGADSISLEFGLYSKEFLRAIKILHNNSISDDLHVFYPDIDTFKLRQKATVFLFAYKKDVHGNMVDFVSSNNISSAYNLGNLHP